MKLAIASIYGDAYSRDKLFDNSACAIGENLLMPNILLKSELESIGFEVHSIDMYNINDIDIVIFQDIPSDSIKTIKTPIGLLKYFLKRKWRTDYLKKVLKKIPLDKRFLILSEPPTVNPISYDKRYHQYFNKILTWSDELADNKKYIKYFIPQYYQEREFNVSFAEKKFLTMICGNKKSKHKNELYSFRRKVIDYFEDKPNVFDLYGFGWERERLQNYKGTIQTKLNVLSEYKYSICFENISNQSGYITEKIFDCFFARTVPVYLGADNIKDYIPENTFINMRDFKDIQEMHEYLLNISEERYRLYMDNIKNYLNSDLFRRSFSVEDYISRIKSVII